MGTGLDLDFVNATHDVSVVLIEISSLMPTNQTNITSLMEYLLNTAKIVESSNHHNMKETTWCYQSGNYVQMCQQFDQVNFIQRRKLKSFDATYQKRDEPIHKQAKIKWWI